MNVLHRNPNPLCRTAQRLPNHQRLHAGGPSVTAPWPQPHQPSPAPDVPAAPPQGPEQGPPDPHHPLG